MKYCVETWSRLGRFSANTASGQRKLKTETGPLDLIFGYHRFLKLDLRAHFEFTTLK